MNYELTQCVVTQAAEEQEKEKEEKEDVVVSVQCPVQPFIVSRLQVGSPAIIHSSCGIFLFSALQTFPCFERGEGGVGNICKDSQ